MRNRLDVGTRKADVCDGVGREQPEEDIMVAVNE